LGSTAYRVSIAPPKRSVERDERRLGLVLVSGLTVFAVAVNGYHPFTEDGGIYLAAVRRLLHSSLYPHDSAFVTAPTRFSAFGWTVAALVRLTGLHPIPGLNAVVLALHLASVWAVLGATWLIACYCWQSTRARAGAVLLMACWLGLPVAGTSLLLMDPYLTARSFATPLILFALWGTLCATSPREERETGERRRGVAVWLAAVLIALAMHPLMAAYGVGASILLAWMRIAPPRIRWPGIGLIGLIAFAGASALNAAAPPESPLYMRIALSRGYWFLSAWHWYELAGIAGPLLILMAFARGGDSSREDGSEETASTALARAGLAAGLLATGISIEFVRQRSHHQLIARLQPMRELQFVYLVMILLLGGWLGQRVLRDAGWKWVTAAGALAVPLYAGALLTTPHSRHLELPGVPPANGWVRAFVWIRENTPEDALFALEPDYVHAPGEDAQCFRAIALRSALADYSKDGGEASIAPQLAEMWARGQDAEAELTTEDDASRNGKLAGMGVSWVVLRAQAKTRLACPYRNEEVAVCRLGTNSANPLQ
jgi:hypothetical protein